MELPSRSGFDLWVEWGMVHKKNERSILQHFPGQ
jgi:hypothetical protein